MTGILHVAHAHKHAAIRVRVQAYDDMHAMCIGPGRPAHVGRACPSMRALLHVPIAFPSPRYPVLHTGDTLVSYHDAMVL